jgi:hypothetical protein
VFITPVWANIGAASSGRTRSCFMDTPLLGGYTDRGAGVFPSVFFCVLCVSA